MTLSSSRWLLFLSLLSFFLLGSSVPVSAAETTNYNLNWCFGDGAGLHFDGENKPTTSNGACSVNQLEGVATISDVNSGELLFYTDGSTIWNKNHQVMETGLEGDASSSQSGIIVPFPDNSNLYYVFSLDVNEVVTGTLKYSTVNMSLNGGLGDVVSKNQFLPGAGGANFNESLSEQVTVIQDEAGEGYWLLTHSRTGNTFYKWYIDDSGISFSGSQSIGTPITGNFGYLLPSPDGSMIAFRNQLFDFNKETGTISNHTALPHGNYGVSFSPDSSVLYVTEISLAIPGANAIYQYDLNAADIAGSEKVYTLGTDTAGALSLGVDGRIYMSTGYGIWSDHLSAFTDPNNFEDPGFVQDYITFNSDRVYLGLPNQITAFFVNLNPAEEGQLSRTGINITTTSIIGLGLTILPATLLILQKTRKRT